MSDEEAKFDVRVRERLVQSGHLKESEISKHLEGLRDVADQAVAVVAKQPALQSESDRDIVIVRTSGVRPPVAPPRLDDLDGTPIDDDLDDEDDDLDDDDEDDEDDEDEETVVKKAPVLEKPAPVAKAVEDDESDEDEKDEKEKKEGEEEKKDVDDEWGDSTT